MALLGGVIAPPQRHLVRPARLRPALGRGARPLEGGRKPAALPDAASPARSARSCSARSRMRSGCRRTLVLTQIAIPPLILVFVYVGGAPGVVALMLLGVCVVGTFGVTMVLSQLYLPAARRDGLRAVGRARDGHRRRERRRARCGRGRRRSPDRARRERPRSRDRRAPLPEATRAVPEGEGCSGAPTGVALRPRHVAHRAAAPGDRQAGQRIREGEHEHTQDDQHDRGPVGREAA